MSHSGRRGKITRKDSKAEKTETAVDEKTEEDLLKEEEIGLLVERLHDERPEIQKMALDTLIKEIKTSSTSLMTLPKPLRFLREHFDTLQISHKKLPESSELKVPLSDVLSLIASAEPNTERLCLYYRLRGSKENLSSWGHEYLRYLSVEIIEEYQEKAKEGYHDEILLALSHEIVKNYIDHNAETHAVDLLLEMESIGDILGVIDPSSCKRVGHYLSAMIPFTNSAEEENKLKCTCFDLYMKNRSYTEAFHIALSFDHVNLEIKLDELLEKCTEEPVRQQIALVASRQPLPQGYSWRDDKKLLSIANGDFTYVQYLQVAKELDLLTPKVPEDVYKSHLESNKTIKSVDSAKENLASTLCNAFLNVGFGSDSLVCGEGKWIYRNHENGITTAVASLGMLYLWNVEESLAVLDKYQWLTDPFIKSGALFGFGISSANVRSECDTIFALLSEQLEGHDQMELIGSLLGIGIAFAGSGREDVLEALLPIVVDSAAPCEISGFAALSLGLTFIGTCHQASAEAIVQALIERHAVEGALGTVSPLYFGLGLSFLFLSRPERSEATEAALEAVEHPVSGYIRLLLDGFAYCGSGDVLKVQSFMSQCVAKKSDEPTKEETAQTMKFSHFDLVQARVLLLPFMTMNEEIGADMTFRLYDHMLQYGDVVTRRAVPLSLAFASISNPKPVVIDILSKLSHDTDSETAINAVLGLGFIGAGTNNARIATLLRQLAAYHHRDASALMAVRISQGILYMAKGLATLNPLHLDRRVSKPVAIAGLAVAMFSLLHLKKVTLTRFPYILFFLALTISPRHFVALDENLNPLAIPTRVGKAVDIVGQAGSPKTITGFQTHTTPVVLVAENRAELATDEYIPIDSCLEGAVILRKNPEHSAAVRR